MRLARVGLHLLWGAATVAAAYPLINTGRQRALKRRWSRQLLAMLGVQLKVSPGETALPPGLLVCNHISWLDIFVINALAPAAFVAKDDVKGWPLIGWLCARTETIFLERGSRAAAQRTRERMIECLQAGMPVAVFPEGTTTGGDRVLPFHAALFQSAIDAQAVVVPFALRYVDRQGLDNRAPAYDGDITLWQCLHAIAREAHLTADLGVLPSLASHAQERRQLAAASHALIRRHIERTGAVSDPATCSVSEVRESTPAASGMSDRCPEFQHA